MKTQASIFVLLCMLITGGCATGKGTVLYRGTYEGKAWTVKTKETRTWNGSRTDWVLKLEGQPAVPIIPIQRWGTPVQPPGPVSTDWGTPYSTDIFGGAARIFFGTAPPYNNSPDYYGSGEPRKPDYTVLYMPPGSTRKHFDAYAGLMNAQWAAADSALTAGGGVDFPHIIGLVAMPRMLAVRRFRGEKGGVKYMLRVEPDGFVNLDHDVYSADQNYTRHSAVQMPGRVIRIGTLYGIEGGWTAAELGKFRDAKGQALEEEFTVED